MAQKVFGVLTYNTLLSNAQVVLADIARQHNPDVICLQEAATHEEKMVDWLPTHYALAEYANSFIKNGSIYGVATFYNTKTLSFSRSGIINLPKSLYEFIILVRSFFRSQAKNRTVLRTDFCIKGEGKACLSVFNAHLSPHTFNTLRNRQLEKTLEDVSIDTHNPVIIVGDFNYPYGRKKLEDIFHARGFSEATTGITYTHNGKLLFYNWWEKLLRGLLNRFVERYMKLDYVFFKNCTHTSTVRIDNPSSDHFPILSTFTLDAQK